MTRSRLDHGMDHILTRDERSAAYMADGYARVTGRRACAKGRAAAARLTCCRASSRRTNRPARARHHVRRPVLSRGQFPLTELDQKALYAPLTKWNTVSIASTRFRSVAQRVPRDDDRPPGRGAHRPALRRAEAVDRSAPMCGRSPATTVSPPALRADPAAMSSGRRDA